jgi:hypothetical protein
MALEPKNVVVVGASSQVASSFDLCVGRLPLGQPTLFWPWNHGPPGAFDRSSRPVSFLAIQSRLSSRYRQRDDP